MESMPVRNVVTGDGRVLDIQLLSKDLKHLLQNSAPSGAKLIRLSENQFSLRIDFKTIDCMNNNKIDSTKYYLIDRKVEIVEDEMRVYNITPTFITGPLYDSTTIFSAKSFNKQYDAILKSLPSTSYPGAKKQVLEIWKKNYLEKVFDFETILDFGSVITHEDLTTFAWCPFSFGYDKLIFIANKKSPYIKSSANYFEKREEQRLNFSTMRLAEIEDINRWSYHCFDPYTSKSIRQTSWGEQYDDVDHTVLVYLDVSTLTFKVTEIEDVSLFRASWQSHERVVCEAVREKPRKLGYLHCNNRPSYVTIINPMTRDQVTKIEDEFMSIHSPRVSEKGSRVLFLKNPLYGAHKHSTKICILDTLSGVQNVIGGDFFISRLPRCPFLNHDRYVVATILTAFQSELAVIDTHTGETHFIEFPMPAREILDFNDDVAIIQGHDFDQPRSIYCGQIQITEQPELKFVANWEPIETYKQLTKDFFYECYEIPIPRTLANEDEYKISIMLLRPMLEEVQKNYKSKFIHDTHQLIKDTAELPTVVMFHGGPHSQWEPTYMPILTMFAKVGLNVLMINYRGSTGVDEGFVSTLCGRIGGMDIIDCQIGMAFAYNKRLIHSDKLIIFGGSHGGFLGAHFSCIREYNFKAAVLRNPVIDLSSMYRTSDIPDWCLSEALGFTTYNPSRVLTGEELMKLFKLSPISRADDCYVPTLVHLGNKDKRVPMSQGLRWIDELKARDIDTMCMVYNDNHALNTESQTISDSIMSSLIWILNYTTTHGGSESCCTPTISDVE